MADRNMRSFRSVSRTVKDPSFKRIFEILASRECTDKAVLDSVAPVLITDAELREIKALLYDKVKANYVNDGVSFKSLAEAEEEAVQFSRTLLSDVNKGSNRALNSRLVSGSLVQDSFYNPMTGVGVKGIDPGMWNSSSTPVSMSPNEATSYYASGGLPQIIIDKKAKGALLNGYHFESDALSEEDRKRLKEYAQSINFDAALDMATRDGLVYGGSLLYPHFKNDTPDTYSKPLNQLIDEKVIDKNCIDYFVTVDRWNCIMVPNYDLTARDYLTPDTMYIPIGGIRVATKRCAVLKPKKLPYWGALRQIGWGSSDFEGYVRSILAYKIVIASIPIMAQQMSLLVHEIPLDGIIAQNGPDSGDAFIEENNRHMREWSMLNPVTINSFGKLTAINRTYEGYDKLIMALRQDVAANSGFAESVLFHTQPTGFSDNTEEITLKQSETIKSINNAILPSLQPIVKIMVYSCFGADSEQARNCDKVRLSFESPIIVSNEEKGKLLEKFSNSIAALKGAGVHLADAVNLTRTFIPEIEISQELLDKLAQSDEEDKIQEKEQNAKALETLNGAPEADDMKNRTTPFPEKPAFSDPKIENRG